MLHNWLQSMLESEFLQDFPEDDLHWPVLLRAILLFRRGALHAAVGELQQIQQWRERDILLLKNSLDVELVLNAVAEVYEHAFVHELRDGGDGMALGMLWGALLGPAVGRVHDYYQQAQRFITRSVGLKYELRWKNLTALKVGDPLLLVREPLNPHDKNAIRVQSTTSLDLGYLRRSLAEILAPLMDTGQVRLAATVACVLDEEWPADQQLHVVVEKG